MLHLIPDPILKTLCLISFFISCEKCLNIVEEYDRRSLYPMVLKCYHYLHSMIEFKFGCVDQTIDINSNLDFFEQIPSTNELTKQLVTKELLIFRCYQANPKIIKCPFQWWGKHKTMFVTIG